MRAYRLTLYRAGDVVARPGRRSASAEAWMARLGVREAGFITAWNPRSRRMPPGWNARRQEALRLALRRHARLEGMSGHRRWQEHNLLVAAPAAQLMRWASRFRQAAILVLRRGQPARLRYR